MFVERAFTVTPATLEAIEEMALVYGLDNAGAMVRKALALARVAAFHADADGIVRFVGKNGPFAVDLKD